MTYRAPLPERSLVCRECSERVVAPWSGGTVSCPRCAATHVLADRGRLAPPGAPPAAPESPERLARLRQQDGRPRTPPVTLVSVLGGPAILPGREKEAMAIWQSLRSRAEAGDAAASEDLSLLTLMLAQLPATGADMARALSETALDAAVLPRHRQEQLGALARAACARGDRTSATSWLACMDPHPDDLESDSEIRVSAAICAALEGDAGRVLELLGAARDTIPIADSMDDLASVFRADALEKRGDRDGARRALEELPGPWVLEATRARYRAPSLCAETGPPWARAVDARAARRAAAGARGLTGLWALFVVIGGGTFALGIAVAMGTVAGDAAWPYLVMGAPIFLMGAAGLVLGRRAGRRAAWIRGQGLSLEARVLEATPTGAEVGDVPVMRFAVEVVGPRGPYRASFHRLATAVDATRLVGSVVRVRAAPDRLTDILLEE